MCVYVCSYTYDNGYHENDDFRALIRSNNNNNQQQHKSTSVDTNNIVLHPMCHHTG